MKSTPCRILLLIAGVAGLALLGRCDVARGAGIEVRIVDVETPAQVSGRDAMNATFVFDKAVPNAQAMLTIDLRGGGQAHVSLWPVTKGPEGKRVELGQPTTRLEAQWSPGREKVTAEHLKGQKATLYAAGAEVAQDRLPASAAAFSVKILEVREAAAVARRDVLNARLVFDKPCPNRRGTLLVALADGRKVTVSVSPVRLESCTGRIGVEEWTTELDAQWSPGKEKVSPQDIQGRDALVYMPEVRTKGQPAPATSPAAAR